MFSRSSPWLVGPLVSPAARGQLVEARSGTSAPNRAATAVSPLPPSQAAEPARDLEALVLKYSGDPGARNSKGNLGQFTHRNFTHRNMVEPFADAAFRLMEQEIGRRPHRAPLGFHIIKRTE